MNFYIFFYHTGWISSLIMCPMSIFSSGIHVIWEQFISLQHIVAIVRAVVASMWFPPMTLSCKQ